MSCEISGLDAAGLSNLHSAMEIHWREGDVIRRLRDAAGWTLEDLEVASGVNLQVIHKIEVGKTKEPTRGTLQRIAAGFGLTWRQLVDAVPPPMDLPLRVEGVSSLVESVREEDEKRPAAAGDGHQRKRRRVASGER
jgi:transcriptional regulator with XRE-family HTH domain